MDKPIALEKAEALSRCMFGAPDIAQTYLTLTDREAWQFLKWYRTQLTNQQQFDAELRAAEALRDPWPVLAGMVICGFEIIRADYQESH